MGSIAIAIQILAAVSSVEAKQRMASAITFEEKEQIVEHFSSEEESLEFETLFSLNGDPNYLMAKGTNGYIIFDRSTLMPIEFGEDDPYSSEKCFRIYNENSNASKYIETNGTKIWEASCPDFKISLTEVGNTKFRTINIPKNSNSIRIVSHYVEYQRQQLCISNLFIEIG